MTSIFISYAREDQSIALEISHQLRAAGFTVWLDKDELLPGQDWEEEIARAIRASDFFIACLSTRSVDKTGYAQKELRTALELAALLPEGKIYIIPVRLDACVVPFSLQKFHWVNYYEAQSMQKLLEAIHAQEDILERLQKELSDLLLRNNPEAIAEKIQGMPRAETVRALLVIAQREDELPSVRSRAVGALGLLQALDSAAWTELLPNASTALLEEWIATWSADDNPTILSAGHIQQLLEGHRLPKTSSGFGKAVRQFIQRGAGYTSAVFLPGNRYPFWEVKYDCVRSIISLNDQDSLRVLSYFSSMSYWKARRRIVDYIREKLEARTLTSQEMVASASILIQMIHDGKSDEKTPTLSAARKLLARLP